MTIEQLRSDGLIILECISGSRAYGLETETSDTDIKGVFLLPKQHYYGLDYVKQVSNESNDIVFYEFGRFMELLYQNNPNILELLATPEHAILYKHPLLDQIKAPQILSKKCQDTFGKFAFSQIKKARGLKKKIVNPMPKERKTVIDFCYVNHENGSLPVLEFLSLKGWQNGHCGLINIAHMHDLYGLYHNPSNGYSGIQKSENSNDISLSSIPKGEKQEALLYFNRNGYSTFCKEHSEYWAWVEKRNDTRFESTQSHGKKYDAKNMMHVFRLLDMAIEIGAEQKVMVKRPNRDFLLEIKAGKFEFDELLNLAHQKQHEMDRAFESSTLPDSPDFDLINGLTAKLRDQFYNLET